MLAKTVTYNSQNYASTLGLFRPIINASSYKIMPIVAVQFWMVHAICAGDCNADHNRLF